MKALQLLRSKDFAATAGEGVPHPVGLWLSSHLKKAELLCISQINAIHFQSSLLQDSNLTGSSPACFLFTGIRQAINVGIGTAQGQGIGPSWLSVCKYR